MSEQQFRQQAQKMGASPQVVNQVADSFSSNPWALLAAISEIAPIVGNNLPTIMATVSDIVAAFKAPGGFNWASLSAVIAKDEPAMVAAIRSIASALGYKLPTFSPAPK